MRKESEDDVSVSALIRNRGKESVTLDLKQEAGRRVLHELIAKADVLVENFSPGVTQRLGIDYESVRALNPRLVYTSISGFGSLGGRLGGGSERKAMDAIIQAMSGIMMTIGEEGDRPGRVGIPVGDLSAPLFGVIGTLSALMHAERTGTGQFVDVSMLGSLTSLVAAEAIDAQNAVGLPTRSGAFMPRLAPFGTFDAADGWYAVCAPTDILAANVLRSIGREELLQTAEFATRDARAENAAALHAMINEWSADRPLAEVLRELSEHGVPASPVRTPGEAVRDEELLARGDVVALEHPAFGPREDLIGPGLPIRFSETEAGPAASAPALGEHTDAVLGEMLGFPPERIQELRDAGVL
jgi:CoA:oxalate CoA-transferase